MVVLPINFPARYRARCCVSLLLFLLLFYQIITCIPSQYTRHTGSAVDNASDAAFHHPFCRHLFQHSSISSISFTNTSINSLSTPPATTGTVGFSRSSEAFSILTPRTTYPAVVKFGQEFDVVLETDASPEQDWKVWLENRTSTTALEIISRTSTKGPEGKDAVLLKVRASDRKFSIPYSDNKYKIENVRNLYTLKVTLGDSEKSWRNAVCIGNYGENIRFIQITDLHIKENSQDNYRGFKNAIKEINLLNPDFAVITGDICDKVTGNGTEETRIFMENILREFEVPVFTLPGNHEYQYNFTTATGNSINDYKNLVNPYTDYCFTVGRYFFCTLDTGKFHTIGTGRAEIPAPNNTVSGLTAGQIQLLSSWLSSDVSRSAAARIVFTHAPYYNQPANSSVFTGNREEFLSLVLQHNVSAVFSGHTHKNAAFDRTGSIIEGEQTISSLGTKQPLFIQTASFDEGSGSFRYVEYTDGILTRVFYDADSNQKPESPLAWSFGNIEISVNSSVTVFECKIRSYHPNLFTSCSLEWDFVHPQTQNQSLLSENITFYYYDSNGNLSVMRVLFDIPQTSSIIVSLRWASSGSGNAMPNATGDTDSEDRDGSGYFFGFSIEDILLASGCLFFAISLIVLSAVLYNRRRRAKRTEDEQER